MSIISFKKRKLKAFSLVEFIIILVIFSILVGISIFNYRSFHSSISITNLANDIALSIRQMQVYGISATDKDNPLRSTTSNPVYSEKAIRGIFFNKEDIILFEDNRDGVFDEDDDIIIDKRNLPSSILIKSICVGDDIDSCNKDINTLHLTFIRPFPDAHIVKELNTSERGYARIDIEDTTSEPRKRSVEIWSSGAIAVIPTP